MPLLYKLYQDTRKKKDGTTPVNPKTYNKWLARTVYTGTIESKALAEKIAYSASATVADTLSVINALVNVIATNLKEGYTVKLDNFGTWKIGITCTGATEAKAFNVTQNIRSAHVNFLPAYTIDNDTHKKNAPMTHGARIQETAQNDVPKD